jgi:RNA polymerase sigma-70 factor (ECF subfamily)
LTREQENLIVQQVLDGDTNAFEELVLEYEKKVYNVALRMVNNQEDAEDITQEAFIKAYNSLSGFRGDSKFSVWLTRIVSNMCLDLIRSRGRRPTISLSVEDEDGENVELEISDMRQSPETLMDQQLTKESVRRGLKQLPDEYREILLLREIQGLSYEEISAALDLEVGTVKSRIYRGRKKLCDYLIKDGNIPDFTSSGKMRGGELP